MSEALGHVGPGTAAGEAEVAGQDSGEAVAEADLPGGQPPPAQTDAAACRRAPRLESLGRRLLLPHRAHASNRAACRRHSRRGAAAASASAATALVRAVLENKAPLTKAPRLGVVASAACAAGPPAGGWKPVCRSGCHRGHWRCPACGGSRGRGRGSSCGGGPWRRRRWPDGRSHAREPVGRLGS